MGFMEAARSLPVKGLTSQRPAQVKELITFLQLDYPINIIKCLVQLHVASIADNESGPPSSAKAITL